MTEKLAKYYSISEVESIKRDAQSSEGRTPEERVAMFIDLMNTVELIQHNFPVEERERRRRVAEQFDRLPSHWWHNFRQEALAEYRCLSSPK